MMTRSDLNTLSRSMVGFDRLARMLDASMAASDTADSYPPYNIEKRGEDAYRITLAVAGFGRDELSIQEQDGSLLVQGEQASEAEKDKTFLHRGIAARRFRRTFQLADHIKVVGAGMEHGLLHIDLVREIPERMKPRRIEISDAPAADARPAIESDVEDKKAA